MKFNKGAYIVVEGKMADNLYILRSGKVELQRDFAIGDGDSSHVILNPGDLFGVVSALSEHLHIDTVIAVTDCEIIAIRKNDYTSIIQKQSDIALKIINGFSERVRTLDEALTKLTFKNSAEVDASHLVSVADYYAKQNKYNQAYYAYYRYVQACPDGDGVTHAREAMDRIEPYQKAVHLDSDKNEFIRSYPDNTMIFSEGEEGSELFIIQSGSVKITKIVNNNEVLLATLKPGDIFGEMALLNNAPRSASAIAGGETKMMVVNKQNFETMVQKEPKMTTKMTTLLAERIWSLYKQLANALIKDPSAKMTDTLLIELEKNRVTFDTKQSYTFALGPEDLIKMSGLQNAEGRPALEKLMTECHISIIENHLHVVDVIEIKKNADFYRKMALRKKQQESSRR
ncbi:MAG: cyclic nucleotide-binding domain-containing protein [Spirochaetales bacterium]|nr:cyclic nucleotide-binding domain-containing protein [Spirochaetales bacterium]